LIVFGKQAGQNAAEYALLANTNSDIDSQLKHADEIGESRIELDFYKIKEEIGNLFYKNVGIIRCEKDLLCAEQKIKEIQSKLHLMGVEDTSKIYNTNRIEFLEFKNILELCAYVVREALNTKESCGAHYRVD